MAGVFSDEGAADALNAVVTAPSMNASKLRLFKNNLVPDNTKVLADFTEADFAGYAPISLSGFSVPSVAAHVASSSPAPATFTITAGSQNVYGWYVTNSAGTKLLFSQRDPAAPVALDSAGMNTYTITATVKAKDSAT